MDNQTIERLSYWAWNDSKSDFIGWYRV